MTTFACTQDRGTCDPWRAGQSRPSRPRRSYCLEASMARRLLPAGQAHLLQAVGRARLEGSSYHAGMSTRLTNGNPCVVWSDALCCVTPAGFISVYSVAPW